MLRPLVVQNASEEQSPVLVDCHRCSGSDRRRGPLLPDLTQKNALFVVVVVVAVRDVASVDQRSAINVATCWYSPVTSTLLHPTFSTPNLLQPFSGRIFFGLSLVCSEPVHHRQPTSNARHETTRHQTDNQQGASPPLLPIALSGKTEKMAHPVPCRISPGYGRLHVQNPHVVVSLALFLLPRLLLLWLGKGSAVGLKVVI